MNVMQALRREPKIMALFSAKPRLIWSGREALHLARRLGVSRDEARDRWRAIEDVFLHADAEAVDREYRIGLSWAWVPGYTADTRVPLFRPETIEEFKLRVTPGTALDVVMRWIDFEGREVEAGQIAETIAESRSIRVEDAEAALRLLRAEEWLREHRLGRVESVSLFEFRGGRDISLERPKGLGGSRV